MNQEVRVMLQLTLDVDATLSTEDVERRLKSYIDDFRAKGMSLYLTDIIEIREEAEIYGNE